MQDIIGFAKDSSGACAAIVYREISDILSQIYVCVMLKEEDRAIKDKSRRSLNYEDVLEGCYKEAGIEIAKWH